MPEHDEPGPPNAGEPESERSVPWALLERYVAGDCTAAEHLVVESWVARDSANAELVATLRAAVRGIAAPTPTRFDTAAARRRVEARLKFGGRGERASNSPVVRARTATVRRSVAIAAALMVALAGSLAVERAGWLASAPQFREFVSAAKSRTTITLRDGTQIVLGPATRLRVARQFGSGARAVELDGEALLTVVHDPRRPFVVRTAHAVVRDVGTTFMVRAYADDPLERIVVSEGQVAVADVGLGTHDAASIDGVGHVTVRRGVDLAADLAWVRGGLAFTDAPLRDVVRELARTYGVDVTIADTVLAGKLVTASFGDEPIDAVLNVVTLAVGAHYERHGPSVVIRSGIAPASRRERTREAEMRFARAATPSR